MVLLYRLKMTFTTAAGRPILRRSYWSKRQPSEWLRGGIRICEGGAFVVVDALDLVIVAPRELAVDSVWKSSGVKNWSAGRWREGAGRCSEILEIAIGPSGRLLRMLRSAPVSARSGRMGVLPR